MPAPSDAEAATQRRRKRGAGRARLGSLNRAAAEGAGWAHVIRSSIPQERRVPVGPSATTSNGREVGGGGPAAACGAEAGVSW